jgi:integrase
MTPETTTPAQSYIEAQTPRLAKNTLKSLKTAVLAFEAWRQDRPITLPLLTEWHTHLANRPLKPTTKNLLLTHTKAFVRWCSDAAIFPVVDVTRLPEFPVKKREPVVLSREEVASLIAACKVAEDQRCANLVLCLLYTGCRRHEAENLTRHSVRQDGLLINSGKTGERVFPWSLLGEARQIFDALPFKWNRESWAAIRKASEIAGLLPKSLRSTAATYLISSGVASPRNCVFIMGHTLDVAEKNYWGAPVWGITGRTMPEFYGVQL